MNGDQPARPANHRLGELHTWARGCAVVVAVLLSIAALIDLRRQIAVPTALPEVVALPAPGRPLDVVETRNTRPYYRHSVIAGGAYTREELATAMRADAVVAAHYSRVDMGRMHTVVTRAPRTAYVSYRIGNRVFWTRKPVQIPAGETLLTDGVTEIRARCGNAVSDIAREPVSDLEPFEAELDELVDDSSIAGERALENAAPLGPSHVPFLLAAQNALQENGENFDDANASLLTSLNPSLPFFFPGDDAGSASNDATSLFTWIEPTPRGTPGEDRVKGGSGSLPGGPGGGGSSGGGSDGSTPSDESNPGGGDNNPGGGSSPGGGNNLGGGSNPGGGDNPGGGSNPGGGNNPGGGSNPGGGNNPGGESNPGGGNSPGGGSNPGGGNNPGDGGNPGGGLPTLLPGSEDLIEDDQETPPVPEPATWALLGFGVAAAAAKRRRR